MRGSACLQLRSRSVQASGQTATDHDPCRHFAHIILGKKNRMRALASDRDSNPCRAPGSKSTRFVVPPCIFPSSCSSSGSGPFMVVVVVVSIRAKADGIHGTMSYSHRLVLPRAWDPSISSNLFVPSCILVVHEVPTERRHVVCNPTRIGLTYTVQLHQNTANSSYCIPTERNRIYTFSHEIISVNQTTYSFWS